MMLPDNSAQARLMCGCCLNATHAEETSVLAVLSHETHSI
jgi:hypothetical protein